MRYFRTFFVVNRKARRTFMSTNETFSHNHYSRYPLQNALAWFTFQYLDCIFLWIFLYFTFVYSFVFMRG